MQTIPPDEVSIPIDTLEDKCVYVCRVPNHDKTRWLRWHEDTQRFNHPGGTVYASEWPVAPKDIDPSEIKAIQKIGNIKLR